MKRLVALLLLPCVALADDWAPNLSLGATWQDNATNADLSHARVSALQTTGDLVANQRYTLTRDDALHVGLHAAAEWWPRFQDLDTGAVGLREEWRHKFGVGAFAPELSVELAADAIIADESGRRGTFTSGIVAFRRRFNDTWRATLTQEFSDHAARFAVYDQRAAQTTLELGCDFGAGTRLTFAGFWRDGDVITYATSGRPDLVAIARDQQAVETFRDARTAYAIDARTLGAKVAFIRALNESAAAIVSYEWRETERSPLRYRNQRVSLTLVRQF